jgi:hypothetical protein
LHANKICFFQKQVIAKIAFFDETVLFGLSRMFKAHFHPFAFIISPLHAMGVKIYPKKTKTFCPKQATPTPGHPIVKMPWQEH